MSSPGTIVTLASLATAVVGLGVSAGAARLGNQPIVERSAMAETPAALAAPITTFERGPDVRSDAESATGSELAADDGSEVRPDVDLDLSDATSAISVTATVGDAITAMESPDAPGVATDGGFVVDDDHAPKVGEIRYFNGRPIRAVRTMRMRVTAYSPDHRSCGIHADGITASGYSVDVNGGRLVAADRRLFPFGSLVSVPGYASGQVVPVLDRGGAIKGSRLDVLYPTHAIARRWGVQHVDVMVWEYADGEPIGFSRPRGR